MSLHSVQYQLGLEGLRLISGAVSCKYSNKSDVHRQQRLSVGDSFSCSLQSLIRIPVKHLMKHLNAEEREGLMENSTVVQLNIHIAGPSKPDVSEALCRGLRQFDYFLWPMALKQVKISSLVWNGQKTGRWNKVKNPEVS